jgi:hypothetical protein
MRRLLATAAAVLLLGAACSSGGSSDAEERSTFCARLERLTQNDPFQAFGDRATSAEIREAFTALVTRTRELAASAPDDVRATARAYAASARKLDSLMAAAAYDGAALDARAYRDAQTDYATQAGSLERYLTAECGDSGSD